MGNKPPRWNDEVGHWPGMGHGASLSLLGRFREGTAAACVTQRWAVMPLVGPATRALGQQNFGCGPKAAKLLCAMAGRAPRPSCRNHYASCCCRPVNCRGQWASSTASAVQPPRAPAFTHVQGAST